ncbi:MAG: cytochrome c biogenesis protein CcsA [Gemmatimonadota bacterium]|nr:cytochrome c biogenesis protein CcsA [Gemmatimonadota bacterium]MDE3126586.1 cytochrome c biogenesis protein CcsA [Gemmatimonadota bacterium]MDE3171698.1 cytochrome c biogenesis protein CcsA [Gemmatimonadota bacterium]
MTTVAPTLEAPRAGRWTAFGVVSIALLVATQAFAFVSSPPDENMGQLEKILYVHVPAAWVMFVCFAIVLVYSLLFLWKGREEDDLVAAAAAEAGAVFNGLTLILGMIWGKPAWGVWWVWDARLTSTLVLFLVFVGYLALRAFVEDPQRRGQWSAAVGILGALNVPIVWMSVTWWRTLHQMPSSMQSMAKIYWLGMFANFGAMLLVMAYFIRRRYEAAAVARAAEHAAQAAALGGLD